MWREEMMEQYYWANWIICIELPTPKSEKGKYCIKTENRRTGADHSGIIGNTVFVLYNRCHSRRQKYNEIIKEKRNQEMLKRKLELQNYQIESLKSMLKQYIVCFFLWQSVEEEIISRKTMIEWKSRPPPRTHNGKWASCKRRMMNCKSSWMKRINPYRVYRVYNPPFWQNHQCYRWRVSL